MGIVAQALVCGSGDPIAMGWINVDASIAVVAGETDAECEPSRSVDDHEAFEAAGLRHRVHRDR